MATIQPTPSQAAVIMQRFFKEQGIEIKLSMVQEALARGRGYTSFQTLQADVDLRKATELVKKDSTADSFWANPLMDGWELHVITGRQHGDDDDTSRTIWVPPGQFATDLFKRLILEDEYEEDADEGVQAEWRNVYITDENHIGTVKSGKFLLSAGLQSEIAGLIE